jgi:hypothetical protein
MFVPTATVHFSSENSDCLNAQVSVSDRLAYYCSGTFVWTLHDYSLSALFVVLCLFFPFPSYPLFITSGRAQPGGPQQHEQPMALYQLVLRRL